jgi:hypothetical protein
MMDFRGFTLVDIRLRKLNSIIHDIYKLSGIKCKGARLPGRTKGIMETGNGKGTGITISSMPKVRCEIGIKREIRVGPNTRADARSGAGADARSGSEAQEQTRGQCGAEHGGGHEIECEDRCKIRIGHKINAGQT